MTKITHHYAKYKEKIIEKASIPENLKTIKILVLFIPLIESLESCVVRR
jgi:hypothetical protein